MAFCRLVFTVLLVSVSCYGNHAPVYMWGDVSSHIRGDPLNAVERDVFTSIVKKELLIEPHTVIFVENTLSTEDLSGKNSFPYLQKSLDSATYLPSVDVPLATLRKVAGPDAKQIDLTSDDEDIEIDSGVTIINFDDAKEGESRFEMLRRHDDIMSKVIGDLQEGNKKVVGIYTGKYPSVVVSESHSRQRRQAQASNETTDEDYVFDNVRLYVADLELREGENNIRLEGTPTATSVANGTVMNTTVTFGEHSFIMNFRTVMGYWYLDTVTFKSTPEEDLHPAEELFAIIGFSYRCGQSTTFTNVNATRTLVFNNLQIQPFFPPGNASLPFGDTFDCVGFFSGAIWAGLLVTFIILLITFYGIIMMMDIRTMDRFDDPKGKTITINAAE